MSREVCISAVSLYVPDLKVSVDDNVARAAAFVEKALESHPDIVCLPEFFATVGTDYSYYEKTVGESADRWADLAAPFQALAARGGCYIITCGPKREEDRKIYNTATLIGRKGEIIGHYRKTHLASGETFATPGCEFPVFETDFGKVAIMICADIQYPEIPRIYALKGAEILFWPTMAWGPTDHFLDIQFISRAIDNQIYAVHSNFNTLPYLPGKPRGCAKIIGPDGEARADTGHRPGVATAMVDLDEGYEYWVPGNWKHKLPTLKEAFLGTRRPELYGELTRTDIPWSAWQVKHPVLYDPDGHISFSEDSMAFGELEEG